MKVLVVGGGAREHAICLALRRSRGLRELYCAPGNAGTAEVAQNVPIGAEQVSELVDWAAAQSVDLVVVGPEAPLQAGIADALARRGVAAFGPSQHAARIETSKSWAAAFMQRHAIPSPLTRACTDVETGLGAIEELGTPLAIKADGLAAGKGVVIAGSRREARETLEWMIQQRGLGEAGARVLLQEHVEGEELSVLAFCDGHEAVLMPAARDYKRLGEGDQGPNTGGMGAYTRPICADETLLVRIRREILQRAVRGLAEEGQPFVGVLYAGLMLTTRGPLVLEFNCRFGDPETQAILPLLESDLLELFEACVSGRLRSHEPAWRSDASCGVVLASEGYPGSYATGRPIQLPILETTDLLFHAGTAIRGGKLVTSGGRVMTAVGLGANLAEARTNAYRLAAEVDFEGCYYRGDIARDELDVRAQTVGESA